MDRYQLRRDGQQVPLRAANMTHGLCPAATTQAASSLQHSTLRQRKGRPTGLTTIDLCEVCVQKIDLLVRVRSEGAVGVALDASLLVGRDLAVAEIGLRVKDDLRP